MLPALRDLPIEHFREAIHFRLQSYGVEVGEEGRVDSHVGIVTKVFDEVSEGDFPDGDAFIVGVVVAAMDEIDGMQMKFLLQLQLEVEAVERISDRKSTRLNSSH